MSDLSTRAVDYLRNLLEDHRDKGPAGITAQDLAREHGIGRIRGKTVYYEPNDFLAAAALLRVRGLDVQHPQRGGARRDSAPGGSEKTGAAAVLAHYVAVVPIHMSIQVPQGARFLAADWRELDPSMFEAILEVENLEVLLELDTFHWLRKRYIAGRPTLAVFRGKPGTFGTAAPAHMLRALDMPVLGFYDFDPEGLAMAASEPRLEALCLPDDEALVAAVNNFRRTHLWTDQLFHRRAQLDGLPAGPVRAAWLLMKRVQCGLPQENFPR